ncbi:hypothetical protein JOF29_003392 [Kribbella aluminosa]|uniref:Uncharacterized protein n=1 Tax=Kribbella aluminosa TaxID=416017 RepID=A0ABS4UL10_9ACTN|nr:hypothetical protein [Kribbella aluminosa]
MSTEVWQFVRWYDRFGFAEAGRERSVVITS